MVDRVTDLECKHNATSQQLLCCCGGESDARRMGRELQELSYWVLEDGRGFWAVIDDVMMMMMLIILVKSTAKIGCFFRCYP